MTKTLLGVLAVGTLLVAACGSDSGSDDGGGDGGGGNPQKDVADLLVDALEGQEVTFDEDCIRDKASQLSDEDAQLIADAGTEGTAPDISDEAAAIGDQLIECVDQGS